jgi:hypothetical protein
MGSDDTRMNASGSRTGQVEASHERDYEPFGCIKRRECLNLLRN